MTFDLKRPLAPISRSRDYQQINKTEIVCAEMFELGLREKLQTLSENRGLSFRIHHDLWPCTPYNADYNFMYLAQLINIHFHVVGFYMKKVAGNHR